MDANGRMFSYFSTLDQRWVGVLFVLFGLSWRPLAPHVTYVWAEPNGDSTLNIDQVLNDGALICAFADSIRAQVWADAGARHSSISGLDRCVVFVCFKRHVKSLCASDRLVGYAVL